MEKVGVRVSVCSSQLEVASVMNQSRHGRY